MEYRPLGDTGLNVGVIGLGVEHLKRQSSEYIYEVIHEAVMHRVNYFDLVWSLPNVIEGVREGIGDTENIHLAVHLGSSYRNDKYVKTRTVKRCEETFHEVLERLNKDSVSVINLHYIKEISQWEEITRPNGVLDLAVRLRDQGYGKILALSTHSLDVVKEAIKHPDIRSVMYQVNLANHHLPNRDQVFHQCQDNGVGLVAMKPLAAGNLLKNKKKTRFPEYKTGGLVVKTRIPGTLTTTKCLHYALTQPGVSCLVVGVKTLEELRDNLGYIHAGEEDKNYKTELEEFQAGLE